MASVQVECHVSGDAKRMAGREGAAPGDLDHRKVSKLLKCKDCKILQGNNCKILQGNIDNSTHQCGRFCCLQCSFFSSVSMYSLYIYMCVCCSSVSKLYISVSSLCSFQVFKLATIGLPCTQRTYHQDIRPQAEQLQGRHGCSVVKRVCCTTHPSLLARWKVIEICWVSWINICMKWAMYAFSLLPDLVVYGKYVISELVYGKHAFS